MCVFSELKQLSGLALSLTLTLKHKNVFGKTKWCYFSGKCTDTYQHNHLHLVGDLMKQNSKCSKHPNSSTDYVASSNCEAVSEIVDAISEQIEVTACLKIKYDIN